MVSARGLLVVLASALLLSGCATEVIKGRFSYEPPGRGAADRLITWPNVSEDRPRYIHVGELLGEQNFDLGFGRTRWQRLLMALAGEDDERVLTELQRPVSITVSPDGNRIFVADMADGSIMVFDPKSGELRKWQDVTFGEPNGMVSLPDGRLLVADALDKKIKVLSATGKRVGEIGTGVLTRPVGLAWDPARRELFVVDTGAHDIKVFSPEGALTRTLGRRGTAPGEFNFPTYLVAQGGRLFVSDTMNSRVQVLDAETGTPLLHFGSRGTRVGNLVRPKGIAVDYDGNIYVAESLYDHLLIYNSQGQLLLPIGGSGRGTGQFISPVNVKVDDGGRVFVVDMFNGRVAVMQYLGGDDE